jgi:UDP:flavonoid glycosyltransferase YjiC (YdhE family)
VPQVVVPHVGDQRYWADRLHQLGVAPKPIDVRDLDAARLADAILTTAADIRSADAADGLMAQMREEDGVRTAADALEAAARA